MCVPTNIDELDRCQTFGLRRAVVLAERPFAKVFAFLGLPIGREFSEVLAQFLRDSYVSVLGGSICLRTTAKNQAYRTVDCRTKKTAIGGLSLSLLFPTRLRRQGVPRRVSDPLLSIFVG